MHETRTRTVPLSQGIGTRLRPGGPWFTLCQPRRTPPGAQHPVTPCQRSHIHAHHSIHHIHYHYYPIHIESILEATLSVASSKPVCMYSGKSYEILVRNIPLSSEHCPLAGDAVP